MIITLRENVFETNSSSCHVITIAKRKDYNDLKNGKTAWKRSSFPLDEHGCITYKLRDDDIVDIDVAFKHAKETIDSKNDDIFYEYFHGDLLVKGVWQWVKENFSRQIFDNYLNGVAQPKVKLSSPIVIHYDWENKDVTYEESTSYEINSIIDWALEYSHCSDCEGLLTWKSSDLASHRHSLSFDDDEKTDGSDDDCKLNPMFKFKMPECDGRFIFGDFVVVKDGNDITILSPYTLDDKVVIESDFEC